MGRRGEIALDPRLSMIARMVGSCACCADIGCDHGRLGAFLLQTGQCKALQMTDISGPSLDKARALMDNLDMADRVRFSVGDGLLGSAPVMAVHPEGSDAFIARGGRIPAPLQSLKN